MRYCGEPKGKTRVCPSCEGMHGNVHFHNFVNTYDKYVGYFVDCPYCAGLGYKEVEY